MLRTPCEQPNYLLILGSGHHVHFPEDMSANTEIQMQMKGTSIVNAHLGFLQHKHKYEIQLKLPVSPTSNSLTPVINTPFIAVGSVKGLGEPSKLKVETLLCHCCEGW